MGNEPKWSYQNLQHTSEQSYIAYISNKYSQKKLFLTYLNVSLI